MILHAYCMVSSCVPTSASMQELCKRLGKVAGCRRDM